MFSSITCCVNALDSGLNYTFISVFECVQQRTILSVSVFCNVGSNPARHTQPNTSIYVSWPPATCENHALIKKISNSCHRLLSGSSSSPAIDYSLDCFHRRLPSTTLWIIFAAACHRLLSGSSLPPPAIDCSLDCLHCCLPLTAVWPDCLRRRLRLSSASLRGAAVPCTVLLYCTRILLTCTTILYIL